MPAPELRIVTDEQWQAAHTRLQRTLATYLQRTNGRLWGKPTTGLAGKYLLTGIARCGCCNGSLEVQSRATGRGQARLRLQLPDALAFEQGHLPEQPSDSARRGRCWGDRRH